MGRRSNLQFRVRLGMRIGEYRALARLSRRDLARLIATSVQQVADYESGATSVSVARIFSIARAVGVTPARLLHGLELEDSHPHDRQMDLAALFATSEEGRRLLEAFMKITDPATRRRAIRYLESLSRRPPAIMDEPADGSPPAPGARYR